MKHFTLLLFIVFSTYSWGRSDTTIQNAAHKKAFIERFSFTGNTVVSNEKLSDFLKEYTDREYSFPELQKIPLKIESLYRKRGYVIARAYLPEQTLRGGDLNIKIIEGRCEGVRIKNNSRISNDNITKIFTERLCNSKKRSPVLSSQELNLAILRSRELLDADGGDGGGEYQNPLKITLSKGEHIGGTYLNLEVNDVQLLSGYLNINNTGSEDTGAYQASGAINFQSIIADGDNLTLGGSLSKGTKAYFITNNYLLDNWRLGYSYNYSLYELKTIEAKGSRHAMQAFGNYSFVKQLTKSLDVNTALRYSSMEDSISTLKHSRNSYGFSVAAKGKYARNALSLTYSSTLKLGRVKCLDHIDENGADNDLFPKLNYDLAFGYTGGRFFQGILKLKGQQAWSNLDSSEKLSLSGSEAVRGFQDLGSVDIGVILSAESHFFLIQSNTFSLKSTLFYDFGVGLFNYISEKGQENTIYLNGAGINFSTYINHLASASIGYSIPISNSTDKIDNKSGYTRMQITLFY